MKITKFGHSCLLVHEQELRILIDPGMFSSGQNSVRNIDVILITHEHQDHIEMNSLKAVLGNNPDAKIFTNSSVAGLLSKENIPATILEHGQQIEEKGVKIEAFGQDHALIHSSVPIIQNRGYFIADRLFYPGDALLHPGRPVEILAWPAFAPWMRIGEGIDYALEVKPKIAFPVHDAILKNPAFLHPLIGKIFTENGIEFMVLELERENEV